MLLPLLTHMPLPSKAQVSIPPLHPQPQTVPPALLQPGREPQGSHPRAQPSRHTFRQQLASPKREGGTNGKRADWWHHRNWGEGEMQSQVKRLILKDVRRPKQFWDNGQGSEAHHTKRKEFSSHLRASKLVKPHRGFIAIFSIVETLWEHKKNWTALSIWKTCCTPVHLWLQSLTEKRHGLVRQFSKWITKLRHASQSRRDLGNSVSSISALRPTACKPGSADHRLRWINIFRAFSLFCFSVLTFYITLFSSHSLFVSRPKEPFNLLAFQPLAADFALHLAWKENSTCRIASPKYSRATTQAPKTHEHLCFANVLSSNLSSQPEGLHTWSLKRNLWSSSIDVSQEPGFKGKWPTFWRFNRRKCCSFAIVTTAYRWLHVTNRPKPQDSKVT